MHDEVRAVAEDDYIADHALEELRTVFAPVTAD
jgi:hypothetical protein